MYVAFFNAGCRDSQVVLALENSAGFMRSDDQNGASVFSTNSPNGVSGTMCWIGFSSRRRAWAMEGSFKNDVPPVDIFDGVRNAGLLFLDLECEALASLSAANDFDGIDRSRVFAYDGVHAAIMVTEGRTRIFCQQVSSGLYDLGVSNPRSDWRNALSTTASSLFVGSTEGVADGTLCGLNSRSERFSSSAWSSVVHMAPNRVAVHQRCTGGATEGLSAHYFRTNVENDLIGLTPMQHGRKDSVQDAFIIFGTHSRDAVRFGPHPRALVHGKSRPSKPQARVAYESPTALKRHKKDPNRPRGYISAFNFFVKDKRPTYVQNRPNAQGHSLEHNNEINKILGKVWKMATEHEKKTYEEKATADKVRYLKEMNAYRPPEGYERIAPRINVPKGFSAVAWDPDVNVGTSTQPCRRPWPAYTHFAHQEKIGVLSSRSNRAKTLMSKAFGQRWHGMPDEETELYKELEEADKERYEKEASAQDTAASLS